MKSFLLSSSVAAVSLSGLGRAQIKVPPEFKPGVKWQIEIANSINVAAPLAPVVPVYDVDLFHVARTPGIIPYLRKQNPDTFIICYFNAGLVQTSDCDYDSVWDTPENRGLLGRVWPEFPDERWVNIKNATAHELIKRRITLANELGCDAVDPDNIDGYGVDSDDEIPEEEKTGWNLTEEDDIAFVRALSTYAHSLTTKRGYTMLIGQKNAPELAATLLPLVDFAVLEDCKARRDDVPGEFPFCSDFQPFVAAGKPVLSIEYPRSIETSAGSGTCKDTGADKDEYDISCDAAQGNQGFSTVLKIKEGDGELNGCTQYCQDGLGKGVVVTATDPSKDGATCPTRDD